MATHDYVIANGTGAAVRSDLNNALAAIVSNNSSSSEPGTTYAYQWWADTNANVLKIRNSSNDGWITLRELDGTLLMEDGSNSSPGLAFASDLDTGFFKGGTNQIGFATEGVARLHIGTSEVVFNDPSNDVDFRVESNGNTHMLFVDAGNDLVGIGTSGPKEVIDARGAAVFSGDHATSQNAYGTAHGIMLSSSSNLASIKAVSNGSNDVAIRFVPLSSGSGSEAMRIDSSGRLLVGVSSSRSVSSLNSSLQVEGTGGDSSTISVVRNVASAAPPRVVFGKSRGTSVGSSIVVQSGDSLGEISFSGADGTDADSVAATILCQVDGTPGSNDMPGRIQFSTTADGASSPTERLRIDSSGNVAIGPNTQGHGLLTLSKSASSAFNALVIQQGNTGSTATDGLHIGIDSNVDAYIFHKESRALEFGTANTERMRINSSGMLQVGGTTSADSANKLEVTSTSGGAIGFLRNDTSTVQGDPIGAIGFYGNDSNGTYQDAARIEVNADGDHATGDKPAKIEFKVSADGGNTPIQRFIIESDGEQRMFSADPSYTLVLNNGASAGTSYLFLEGRHSATSNTGQTGTRSLSITTNGNIFNTNNSYGQISDVKLKENIVNASSQWDDIKGVQVRNFNFKEETGHPTHTQIGVVAQELETVPPGLVYDTPDVDADRNDLGTVTKTVNYSVLYMKAVKALQEAMDRIETLETKVAALEAG